MEIESALNVEGKKKERSQDDPQVDPKDQGLKVLYTPPISENGTPGEVVVDIIAIHGLGAHPKYAWVEKNTKVNWIKDKGMLPSVIPSARILGYGYDAKWFGEDAIKKRIKDMAYSFLRSIRRDLERKAVCIARSQKERFPDIFKACRGAVLLGTPHRGTGDFTSEEMILRLVNAHVPMEVTTSSILKPDSETLVDMVEEFKSLISLKKVRDRLRVFCFFEQISTQVSDVLKNVKDKDGREKLNRDLVREFVVDRDSAVLEVSNSNGLPLNHFQLNKYTDPEDEHYKDVCSELIEMVKEALNSAHSIPRELPNDGSRPHAVTTQVFTKWKPPYDKDPNFQGRSWQMKRMADKFENPDRKHRVVVHGEHGIGKTHLAVNYAHKFSLLNPNSKTFWIPSKTFAEFERACTRLGKDLHIPGIENPSVDRLSLVTSYLSDADLGPWLMVLEGVDNIDMKEATRIREWFPSNPIGPVGAVLITTSNRKIAGKLQDRDEDTFALPPFTDEETVKFVREALPKGRISDDETCRLRDITGYLPLALAQAVAFLSRNTEVKVTEYLENLKTIQAKLENPNILPTTIFTFKYTRRTAPEVALLARIVSKFGFQTAPAALLQIYDKKVGIFLRLMSELAIITCSPDGGQISMSSLTGSSINFIQSSVDTDDDDLLSEKLAEKFPHVDLKQKLRPQTEKACEYYLPYAKLALEIECRPTTNDGKRSRATLLLKSACYDVRLSKFEFAIPALKECLQLRQDDNPKSQNLIEEAKTSLEIAETRAKRGVSAKRDSVNATPKFDMVTKAQEKKVPDAELPQNIPIRREFEQNPGFETIKTQEKLAASYEKQQKYKEAMAVHEKIHEWCKKEYPDGDAELARQTYRMGLNLDRSGNYQEAEQKYRESWKLAASSLGENHPEVSRTICNLATLCDVQGRREEAQELFGKALYFQQVCPGLEEDTLMTKHNYAVFKLGEKNKKSLEEAENTLSQVLQQQDRLLGSDNLDTIRTASNLSNCLRLNQKYDASRKLSGIVLSKQTALLGGRHPDTLATRKILELMSP